MLYSFDCKECEGVGLINENGIAGVPHTTPCPHCKGSGGFNLGVECENCGGKGEYDSDGYGNIINCEDCAFAGYTVLTVDEVAGIEPIIFMEILLHDGPEIAMAMKPTYKGQPVKLMPREG